MERTMATARKTLDRPGDLAFVRETFDRAMGYDAWHRFCRAAFSRTHAKGAFSPLALKGFETIKAFNPCQALEIKNYLEDNEHLLWEGNGVETARMRDTFYTFGLLLNLFTDDVERRITGFLKSEFFVYSLAFLRSSPGVTAKYPPLWHREPGPTGFVTVILSLNGSDEHGGGISCLDRETSAKIGEAGYAFPRERDLADELSAFAGEAKVPYEPSHGWMAAGQALLFRPRDVLHRALPPERRACYMLSLVLLPSPIRWQEAFKRWTLGQAQRGLSWSPTFMSVLRRGL